MDVVKRFILGTQSCGDEPLEGQARSKVYMLSGLVPGGSEGGHMQIW